MRRGADIDARNKTEYTPLHWASFKVRRIFFIFSPAGAAGVDGGRGGGVTPGVVGGLGRAVPAQC